MDQESNATSAQVTICFGGALRARGTFGVAECNTALAPTGKRRLTISMAVAWETPPLPTGVMLASGSEHASDAMSAAESALARVVRSDDRPAAAGLFDRHGGLLFGLAMSMLRDQEDAETVVVRTFDDVCRAVPSFQSATDVRNWLLERVRAHAISIVRERIR